MAKLFKIALTLPVILALNIKAYADNNSTIASPGYCMAIRGNGELEPAHWGALSNVVEKLGLPKAEAGGSSGAISMMFMESIAANKYVQAVSGQEQALRAALLIKSLQGFVNQLAKSEQWKNFMALFAEFKKYSDMQNSPEAQKFKNSGWEYQLATILANTPKGPSDVDGDYAQAKAYLDQNQSMILNAMKAGEEFGFISKTSYSPLFNALNEIFGLTKSTSPSTFKSALSVEDKIKYLKDVKIAKFYAGELKNALMTFGAFDAQTDDNLFFRPGLVDFDVLAAQLGRIADFYSTENLATDTNEASLWETFMNQCTAVSAGKTWQKLTEAEPSCADDLENIMKAHFHLGANGAEAAQNIAEQNFADRKIGQFISSFPATAVLTGTDPNSANQLVQAAQRDYARVMDPNFGKTFVLNREQDIKFGYWGRENDLALIQSNFKGTSDEKSQRFMPLGQGTWREALGLSPAEPGLSPLKGFYNKGVKLTAAGGWADLHPVLVLKAAGCENVVYVTRRGGESLFAEGVAKRLLGDKFGRDWNDLKVKGDAKELARVNALNDSGDSSANPDSLWSKLFNLGNENSSFKNALRAASAILCTDWNSHEITEGPQPMVDDAYTSPFYFPARGDKSANVLGEEIMSSKINPAQTLDPATLNSTGSAPKFAGCF